MELALSWAGPGLALAAVVVAGFALWTANHAAPTQLLHRMNNLSEVVEFLTAEMEKHSIRVHGWKGELDTVLENVETCLSQVERKRRSIAASASKLATPEPEPVPIDPNQLPIADLERYARAKGLMGVNRGRG